MKTKRGDYLRIKRKYIARSKNFFKQNHLKPTKEDVLDHALSLMAVRILDK